MKHRPQHRRNNVSRYYGEMFRRIILSDVRLKGTRQRFYSFLSLASEEINDKVIMPKNMTRIRVPQHLFLPLACLRGS
jgi:hypothetical protein